MKKTKRIECISLFMVILFFIPSVSSSIVQTDIPPANEDSFSIKVASDDVTFFDNESYLFDSPDYLYKKFCGSWESIDQYGYATSVSSVHTYCSADIGFFPGCIIYANLYVTEQRQGRTKAYLITPCLEYLQDGKWISHSLAWFIIWENSYYNNTYIGQGGIGKAFQKDKFVPFRLYLKIFDESERRVDGNKTYINFTLNQTGYSSIGIWFYDVPPYSTE